ncbi:unnamed protein product, partial [Phaeothamnion confervicola]
MHGLLMFSVDADMRSSFSMALHRQPVRDAACQPGSDFCATVAFDRRLNVVDTRARTAVLEYELPAPGWSCTWSGTDAFTLFCGLGDGTVRLFDLRST